MEETLDEDYDILDEESRDAEWDGDQTKYVPPPPPYQSVKDAWEDITTDGLTRENVLKHSGPVAKDLGVAAKEAAVATKEAAVAAKGFVGHAFGKVMETAAAARLDLGSSTAAAAAASAYNSVLSSQSSSNVTGSYPPTPLTVETKVETAAERRLRLSIMEETALADAYLSGELPLVDKQSDEVQAFLARFREQQALEELRNQRAAGEEGTSDTEVSGVQWTEEADTGLDALAVSEAWKRPGVAKGEEEEERREALCKRRASKKDDLENGSNDGDLACCYR
ncbi:MAG: hypothetical protein Q9219_000545 [cf. Caloplaca sp. 3 TL-2023]